MRTRPDVSVVVIAYNDARRLPRAVGSVLAQSLHSVEAVIVDDASTDGTGRVAERLAAAYPGRVRAMRLAENSGGCGRPRNVGVERSDGRYVMFLDSDDLLDRHACLNLVAAAEETGADLVSGLCTRVILDRPHGTTGRERPWYPWLYERSAVYGSLTEKTDLLYDTLSTNKAYRRGFLEDKGLAFTEDLHYEDLLFTAEAYLRSGRTAVIPHRVYDWLVEREAGTPSISNRRAELANFADRLEIHRRIDALFARHGADEPQRAKDAKFINHDLLLYLRELRGRDPLYRARFLDLAAAYLSELDPEVFERANRLAGIAAFQIRAGDHAGALAAAECGIGRRPELRTPLTERDGRVFWATADGRPQDEAARRVLDVTDFGFHQRPLREISPGNTVTRLDVRRGRVQMAGRVLNPLDRVAPDADLGATLEFYDRRRPARIGRIPAAIEHDGDHLTWRADFDPRRRVRPWGFIDPVWDVRLRVDVDGDEMITRPGEGPGAPPLAGVAVPVRPRMTRLAADRMRSYVTDRGHLAFGLEGHRPWTRLARAAVYRAAYSPAGRRAWRRIRAVRHRARELFTSRETKQAVFNRVLTRLPVRRDLVVFESHLGAQYSDSPKYLYRELRRSGRPVRAVWSYASSPRGFPGDAKLVRRGSWPYYLALARAAFWVDNQGFPDGLRKRDETTYIQTWHGSAYKRMGRDQPAMKAGPRSERARLERMVGRWDCFLVRSGHDVRTLASALGVRGELVPAGYPRNDPLVNGVDGDPELADEVAALRRSLGLVDDGRRVVLYAPTFRKGPDGRPIRRVDPPLDPERLARELGGELILLVRPHYLTRMTPVPPSAGAVMRDVGDVPDVTPLLLLADALVTDHSSVMFDYALLDRPIVLHVPDEDVLGSGYFDLPLHAPGPITRTEDELIAALGRLDELGAAYAGRRRAFAARFGEHDRGTAARTVVDRYFGGSERARTA
ncbi:bifunctional glycosyltransferase/CDP-glycerol:glycerophosphate glycerophosphotransferase [Spirillospora albida]|uniref:bifunctional glycosyltransferase/CDP-glycerol:glycerophosphate glycerophosphotransferase n=1 Tax=Spirillospora albida TaxID=58123 RepID=UPI0004C2184E|nr:CDP-glycerol glycerophosphotransferase family protein [Spirillospora albida]